MRPITLLVSLWACWSSALATAQTPQQRPSALRDAGVITRAAPTSSSDSATYTAQPTSGAQSNASVQHAPPGIQQSNTQNSGQNNAQNNAQNNVQMPSPGYPAMPQARGQSPAFSDQAWTGSPAQSRTSGRVSDTNNREPNNSSIAPVVTAEFATSGSTSGKPAIRRANHQSSVGEPTAHEPKPLKPPSSAVTSKSTGKGSAGTVQMFVSVLSSLAIVIGLILAAAWFYRKAAPTMTGALPKQVVQVLGRTPLAPRQQLVLLRLGSKLVLVSNLHGDVRAITEVTDPLEVDRLSGLCEAAQPGSISESFRSVLHNMGRNG